MVSIPEAESRMHPYLRHRCRNPMYESGVYGQLLHSSKQILGYQLVAMKYEVQIVQLVVSNINIVPLLRRVSRMVWRSESAKPGQIRRQSLGLYRLRPCGLFQSVCFVSNHPMDHAIPLLSTTVSTCEWSLATPLEPVSTSGPLHNFEA